MKRICGITLILLAMLAFACAQKINDPADVQAINNSMNDFQKAVNAGDAGAVAALMTDKTVFADLNVPVAVGAEAIKALWQPFFDQFMFEFSIPVEDVRITGDVAVARGTWTIKATPKTQGVAGFSNSGSWMVAFARQNDGSWKWDSTVANSNQPLPGTTADGAEEKALIQIEQDWATAMLKSDATVMERFLAKEWTYNSDGQVINRAQALAEVKSGAYKIASLELSDLSPHVFGDAAVVTMTAAMKGTYKGKDISGQTRSTDFFVKRDGQWQAVSTQNVSIK